MSFESIHKTLAKLLKTPSPVGACAAVVDYVSGALNKAGWAMEHMPDGGLIANWKAPEGNQAKPLVFAAHLDTLGAQIKAIKASGRLEIVAVGTWSARFAEGARVQVLSDHGSVSGTILPLKASGHAYNEDVDTQPVAWDNLEIRLDAKTESQADTEALGIKIGDLVAIDTQAEFLDNGFIISRHLDDKAAIAVLLETAKDIAAGTVKPTRPVKMVFSVSEEVGTGSSQFHTLSAGDVIGLDIGIVADGHASKEDGIAICMGDSGGPYDRPLSLWIDQVCNEAGIACERDVFRYYYSDLSAIKRAGGPQRMALLTFGVDASHGYERTHMDSLKSLHAALAALCQAKPL